MFYVVKYFLSEDDTEEEKRTKRIVVACSMFFVLLLTYISLSRIVRHSDEDIKLLIPLNSTATVLCFVLLTKWFITKKQTNLDRIILIYIILVVILITDVVSASEMREPIWPAAVLVVDLILLCSLPAIVGRVTVSVVVVYLLICAVEKTTRFGLYDVRGVKMIQYRDCFLNLSVEEIEATPCKQEAKYAFGMTFFYLGVFLMDYYCTRKFASEMRSEQMLLKSSMDLAETVASALVKFDLEKAQQHIDCENTPLTTSLGKLLRNLNKYKPYLPDSLFTDDDKVEGFTNITPPPGPQAAILFTDMKMSTSIWEASPEAMRKALKLHNRIIRNCIVTYKGYEVKTIGDAFMVAFQTFSEGCKFAAAVQEEMMSATWPSGLILPSIFEENGWRGLMIRIGLHFGDVDVEVNPFSGRSDYFGRAVNKAARLENICPAGGIAVDTNYEGFIDLGTGWSLSHSTETLRGIEKPEAITLITRNHVTLGSSSGTETKFSHISLRDKEDVGDSVQQVLISRNVATTCHVRFLINSENSQEIQNQFNAAIEKSVSCLERTEGSIVSVLCTSIVLGWNTNRSSPDHFRSALQFVSLLHGLVNPSTVSVGIATSPVHCGCIGTRDQRFITVFGKCINLCGLLCQAGCDIKTFALCAPNSRDLPIWRPVDRWLENGETNIVIYELQAAKLKRWLTLDAISNSRCKDEVSAQAPDWGWSDDYWETFASKDWEAIDHNKSPEDHVLKQVAEMMRRCISMRMLTSLNNNQQFRAYEKNNSPTQLQNFSLAYSEFE